MGNTYIDNLAHKILHTFEKMDAINPTFERIDILKIIWLNMLFFNFNHLFGLVPFVTQVNTHLNWIAND